MTVDADRLLGNGKLTVAGRAASVFNAIVSIVGGGFLFWFGQNMLDKLDRVEKAMYESREQFATLNERNVAKQADARRTRSDLDGAIIDIAKLDRRVLVLETRR